VLSESGCVKAHRGIGIGVRIEDDLLITADGYENMSKLTPVDADAVDAMGAEESALPLLK